MKITKILVAAALSLGLLAGNAATAGAASATAGFVAHGITLSGLQNNITSSSIESPMTSSTISRIEAQILASRRTWHANTVRLQIVQDKLVGANGKSFSSAYMGNVRSIVHYAESLGLRVVINDQTEPSRWFPVDEPLPTYATNAFWGHMDKYYANDPLVIYDIFNEPRGNDGWGLWQSRMQMVVSYIRNQGAHNVIWAEGINYASTLDGAGSHLLRGGPITYSFHHPAGSHNAASWDADFGYLTARHISVVDGEWTNYAGGYCWANAPASVPAFFRYLSAHGVGMTAWTLLPGVLESRYDRSPLTMHKDWNCYVRGQGSGSLIRNWYKQADLSLPLAVGVYLVEIADAVGDPAAA
jgi:hypothetical protein